MGNITDNINEEYFNPSSSITKYGTTFQVKIRNPKNNSVTAFAAVPVSELLNISEYLDNDINQCSIIHDCFAYFPKNDDLLFDGIKKHKIYGVVDSLKCGPAYSITVMQRYYNKHVEIAVPILFCLFCNNGTEDCTLNNTRDKGKQVVSIRTLRIDPISTYQPINI